MFIFELNMEMKYLLKFEWDIKAIQNDLCHLNRMF